MLTDAMLQDMFEITKKYLQNDRSFMENEIAKYFRRHKITDIHERNRQSMTIISSAMVAMVSTTVLAESAICNADPIMRWQHYSDTIRYAIEQTAKNTMVGKDVNAVH